MTQTKDKYKQLSNSELTRLAGLYSKMSRSAKDAFIVLIMTKFEDNFEEIIVFLGVDYERSITRA